MSAFDTLTAIPSSITAGEAVSWEETLSDYPGASYAVAYKFAGQTPQDGFVQFSITGTESETAKYTFTTATDLKPGSYNWEKQVTKAAGSVMRVIERGQLVVAANLATAPTTTTAATMVAAIKTALATLATSTTQSVNFNGQEFTRRDQSKLQLQLVYWESRVLFEQQRIAALSGTTTSRSIGVRFV